MTPRLFSTCAVPDEFSGPLGHIREATNVPLHRIACASSQSGSSKPACGRGLQNGPPIIHGGAAAAGRRSVGCVGIAWRDGTVASAWLAGKLRSARRVITRTRASLSRRGNRRVKVLTETIRASGPIPGNNRAALNGFAVESSASLEASSYNPIQLPLIGVAARDVLPASYLPYVASGLRRVWRRRVRSRLLSHKIYYRSRKGKGRFSVPTEFSPSHWECTVPRGVRNGRVLINELIEETLLRVRFAPDVRPTRPHRVLAVILPTAMTKRRTRSARSMIHLPTRNMGPFWASILQRPWIYLSCRMHRL